jgi:hypothetical protein
MCQCGINPRAKNKQSSLNQLTSYASQNLVFHASMPEPRNGGETDNRSRDLEAVVQTERFSNGPLHARGRITAVLLVVALYVAGYFLLMVRYLPVRENGVAKFKSTYRLAASANRSGPYHLNEGKRSVFNCVFYPADLVFYSLFPYDPKPLPVPESSRNRE